MATRSQKPRRRQPAGIGQLSIVEHALCPLDPGQSLRESLVHECQYDYTDPAGARRNAQVRVSCPLGLSPQDEFYLWGLLALTFSQPQPDQELHATPHYCLRQLGVIDQRARRGGRQYRQFAAALERLSEVRYRNEAFYDPIRAEHRRVSFGLLSYSLPLADESSRAWRIAWDPLFFELVSPIGGHLRFDLETYRELDPASRRLFLLLSKMFSRRAKTAVFDLHQLGVQVLGFAPTVATRNLKVKLNQCIKRLMERDIISPDQAEDRYERRRDGSVSVRLDRGRHFQRRRKQGEPTVVLESPLFEPLRAIGVDAVAIPTVITKYPGRLIREWVDITLAAKERFGPEFFKRSPAAYLMDNLRNAAQGRRTPPDWWHDVRRAEQRRRSKGGAAKAAAAISSAGRSMVPTALPAALTAALQAQFEAAGQSPKIAKRNAQRFARQYWRKVESSETDSIERLLQLLAD